MKSNFECLVLPRGRIRKPGRGGCSVTKVKATVLLSSQNAVFCLAHVRYDPYFQTSRAIGNRQHGA